ncbi:insulin-degrading enzyme-like 2 isoform X2 [Jatropha curcas]|uniref:insulin-degrading enzyme-like 2 isoform X2 n=1 Tax=Jatropha curcas TaxID=180498 RepID=UPI0009D6FBA1|nr:insulin-degrading enzyme-like 2 isoform X2 [Jatropha curcas]
MATEEVEIVKPRNDKREYRRIVLKNSLEVLLVSDPDTDKFSAVLQWMSALVTSAIPLELKDSPIFSNICCFILVKNIHWRIVIRSTLLSMEGSAMLIHLLKTPTITLMLILMILKRLWTGLHSSLLDLCYQLTQPRGKSKLLILRIRKTYCLMAGECTRILQDASRKRKNWDAYLSKDQLSESSFSSRPHKLQKHLSDHDHPYHKFNVGNLESLENQPKEKGLDIRAELIKFYEENYSANLMHLVVYAKESLDAIQTAVEDKFQQIRSNGRSRIFFPGQPCMSEHLQILVKAVPIEQGHELRIVWPVTPSILHYKEGPCSYLSYLIGHEGEGSLFHFLKTLGWATSLFAGEEGWNWEFSFFTVTIDLTDDGHEHMGDIVGLLFKYIHLLQQSGVCKWIFDEIASISETEFHYQDKSDPVDYAVDIASNMKLYPPEDWLVQSSIPTKFCPSTIQSVLDDLSPNNVRIFWQSNKFEGQTNMVEPWYKTAYSIEKINDSMIQEWILSAPNGNLHLPVVNLFIPSDLSLKYAKEKVKFPSLARKSSYASLWYKPDTMFSTPKAYVMIDFNCPYARSSPESEVRTIIFTELVEDYLNEYAYSASVAGLYYFIQIADSGFQVTVAGYNHKLRTLLDAVIGKIAKFYVNPERFAVIKEKLIKNYENLKFEQPNEQATHYSSLLLLEQKWPWTEKLEALRHLEAEDLAKFTPMMLSRAFLECYIAGNIECSEAVSIIQYVEDALFKDEKPICHPLFPSQHLTNRVVKLERGTSYFYRVKGLNPSNENSALVHYIQVHQDEFTLNVKLQLFTLIAKQAAFHQLRTVEQLGYITTLRERKDFGIRGIEFIIQSTVQGPGHIDLRIEAFLRIFENKIYEMTDDEFKSNIKALIEVKLEKHKNIWEESAFYCREITVGTLKFDRRECEVMALKQLTKQEFIDFFNEYIRIGAPNKRTLSIGVYGKLHSLENTSEEGEPSQSNKVQIDDIFSFRRSQPLYSSFTR